ncbi:hypothetical protein WMW72_10560 [Paenibacillus filicis]|uniref:N-acetylmuramoyl-L-alanine amidase n=1 Tax=Paenibacillus filicis TaxID=669464 RepID=A0ABU9DHK9_9BACL
MNLSISQEIISSLGVQQLVDWRRELPVNPNYTWAQLAGIRDVNALTTIAVHHDGIKKASVADKTDKQLATIIANNHIRQTNNESKGDAGFPYHVWIRNGTAYYCNNAEDRTYGVGGNNGYTVHVCVHGEYAGTDALTDQDRNALYAIILTLKSSLPKYQAIKGHNEIGKTDCPGFSMQKVREDVAIIETRSAQQQTWAAKLNKVGDLANQYQYMFDLIKAGEGDGNAQWAVNQLLAVRDVLVERKLL